MRRVAPRTLRGDAGGRARGAGPDAGGGRRRLDRRLGPSGSLRLSPEDRVLLEQLADAGRRLGDAGLLVADDGNLSARRDGGSIWITPRGVRKSTLRPSDLVRVDLDGRKLEGEGDPSSELPLHLALYRRRRTVGAVVHAHPPAATGFAAAGVPIEPDVLPEAVLALGPVPVVPYRMPGTAEVGEAAAPFADSCRAFLLANHGAVALGAGVEEACLRMERLEHVARVLLAARLLGGARPLATEERDALTRARREGDG
ncbi:MAG: class II aldolase/adducin family protein [Candidatus Eisenbacteria bacterium]|nr:class II aldolase/adducin family protein [Candidatus Latescibacterota bacterium]MBD3302344.1 class II aldolase/adducin family protein [Candidatus Eisenbacteria bacterium]